MGILVGVFAVAVFLGGAVSERIWGLPILRNLASKTPQASYESQRVVNEENVVTDVAEKVSGAVVTVSYKQQTPVMEQYFLDPFGMFRGQRPSGKTETETVDIGSGFIVDASGLVVTNKHVVSQGSPSDYKVVLKDDSEHEVTKIWRDPANDLAILQIAGSNFQPVELGDSDHLKVGNFVIAIGTALGEFRHTVTTGVVSGLGRGITAGDGFSGAEKLDNVIQTDAAINPGNSGGPLLNSAGQVVGVNVAVSQGANNIGFALPINLVKASLTTFNETGKFDRPFFGVRYQLVTKEQGILNNVPAGAYVVDVVAGSSAEVAGIKKGDMITKFDGVSVAETKNGLAELLAKKKVGDTVAVDYYRDGKVGNVNVTLKGES
jgi:S1-C subfamily serine protease